MMMPTTAAADLLLCFRVFGPPAGSGPSSIAIEASLCTSGAFDTEDCSPWTPYTLPAGPSAAVQLVCADYTGQMSESEFWGDFVPNRKHRGLIRFDAGNGRMEEMELRLAPSSSLDEVPQTTARARATYQLWPTTSGGLEMFETCPSGAAGCP